MKYLVKAWAIVGYMFEADSWCSTCIIETLIARGEASPAARDMREEDVLDQVAAGMSIDREDEGSFDSGEFPKVILASNLEGGEHCCQCHDPLL